jgi:predicted ThiF/HesA family dinucleotide-utilizing enzyme
MPDLAQDKQKKIAFFDGHAAIDGDDVFTRVESQRLGERSVTNLKRLGKTCNLGRRSSLRAMESRAGELHLANVKPAVLNNRDTAGSAAIHP